LRLSPSPFVKDRYGTAGFERVLDAAITPPLDETEYQSRRKTLGTLEGYLTKISFRQGLANVLSPNHPSG
jgi:hypothetical protein